MGRLGGLRGLLGLELLDWVFLGIGDVGVIVLLFLVVVWFVIVICCVGV